MTPRHAAASSSEGAAAVAPGARLQTLQAAATAVGALTRVVQDFPSPGVLFRDLTPVLADRQGLPALAAGLSIVVETEFDLVAGLDARGFLFGTAVAVHSGTGVLAVRKAGKLAGSVIGEDYDLEYGSARIEVHPDDVPAGSRILIVDDVLATGGTAAAAVRLLTRAGGIVVGVAVAMELTALGGRDKLGDLAFGAIVSA